MSTDRRQRKSPWEMEKENRLERIILLKGFLLTAIVLVFVLFAINILLNLLGFSHDIDWVQDLLDLFADDVIDFVYTPGKPHVYGQIILRCLLFIACPGVIAVIVRRIRRDSGGKSIAGEGENLQR